MNAGPVAGRMATLMQRKISSRLLTGLLAQRLVIHSERVPVTIFVICALSTHLRIRVPPSRLIGTRVNEAPEPIAALFLSKKFAQEQPELERLLKRASLITTIESCVSGKGLQLLMRKRFKGGRRVSRPFADCMSSVGKRRQRASQGSAQLFKPSAGNLKVLLISASAVMALAVGVLVCERMRAKAVSSNKKALLFMLVRRCGCKAAPKPQF